MKEFHQKFSSIRHGIKDLPREGIGFGCGRHLIGDLDGKGSGTVGTADAVLGILKCNALFRRQTECGSGFLEDLGVKESGLERVINTGYSLLDYITFFTTGADETRAWTVTRNALAPQAAGKIHTDMERGFIRMEVVSYSDLVEYGSWNGAKEAGKLRTEGKEYVVQDGDCVFIRFNV